MLLKGPQTTYIYVFLLYVMFYREFLTWFKFLKKMHFNKYKLKIITLYKCTIFYLYILC